MVLGVLAAAPGRSGGRRGAPSAVAAPHPTRSGNAVEPSRTFQMVGVRWKGAGRVRLQARSTSGTGRGGWRSRRRRRSGPGRRAASACAGSGDVRDLAVTFITSPRVGSPARGTVIPARRRPAGDRHAGGMARRRVDPPGRSRPTRRPSRWCSCTTPIPRPRCAVLGLGPDRARHLRLPRAHERLERHRLQLPRRQVRHGLRGPLRRHDEARDRGADEGVQHGLRRHRDHRDVQLRPPPAGRRRGARAPDRLAARRRARRPRAPRRDGVIGEPALPRRPARRHERRLRATATATRRRARGRRSMRSCRASARRRGAIGLPKIWAPTHTPNLHRIAPDAALPARAAGQVLEADGVHAHDPRPRRRGRRPPPAHERPHPLDVGRPGGGASGRALLDGASRRRERARVRGHARRAAAVGAARAAGRVLGVAGDGHRRRACEPRAPRRLDARPRAPPAAIRGRSSSPTSACRRPGRSRLAGTRAGASVATTAGGPVDVALWDFGSSSWVDIGSCTADRRAGVQGAGRRRTATSSQAGTRPSSSARMRVRYTFPGGGGGRLRPRAPQRLTSTDDDLVGGVRDAGDDQAAVAVHPVADPLGAAGEAHPAAAQVVALEAREAVALEGPVACARSPRGCPPGGPLGRPCRPLRSRSEVGATRASAGRSPASWFAFTPMPTTTSPSRTSARMPASLCPSTTTSFGQRTPPRATPRSATASATTSVSGGSRLRRRFGVKRQREQHACSARALPLPAPAAAPGRLLLAGRDPALGQAARQLLGGRARLPPHVRLPEAAPQEGPHDLGTQRALPHAH